MLNVFHTFVMIFRRISVTVTIVHELMYADLNTYEKSRKLFPITMMIDN